MKIAVGIVATDKDEYQREAQDVWKRYMHANTNVCSYFLKYDNTKRNRTFHGDTFYCHSDFDVETKENMVTKSLEFMKTILQDDSWHYMLCTNLSSVFNWDNVLALLSANQQFDIIANHCTPPYKKAWPVPMIPMGCGMFLSRKAVEGVVTEWTKDTSSLLDFAFPDDVMVGILLGRAGFCVIANYKYNIVLPYMPLNRTYLHLRCKIFNEIDNRIKFEIPMMHKWVDYWYF